MVDGKPDLENGSLSGSKRGLVKRSPPPMLSSAVKLPADFAFWSEPERQEALWAKIQISASHRIPVLIVGESGTGKEIVARMIWNHRRQAKGFSSVDAPFIAINSAAIPTDLSESLLFGHERGAFTSARERQFGRFELARKGSIFIDEIQCMNLAVQSKLLRALETGVIEPLGSRETKTLECQVIAASNFPLELLVSRGQFRQDLYYRLSLLQIFLPALREQLHYLPELCEKMLQKIQSEYRLRKSFRIRNEVIDKFCEHNWPGNLRELEHTLLYSALHVDGSEIGIEHLPPQLTDELSEFLSRGNWQ